MTPYQGNEPYLFISYAHKDNERVLPILEALSQKGFRIWYDAGIQAGSEWTETLEGRLLAAQTVILFVSRASLDSKFCRREIIFADNRDTPILPVYLETVTELRGLGGLIESSQALFCEEDARRGALIEALTAVERIRPCRAVLPPALTDTRALRLYDQAMSGDTEAAFSLAQQYEDIYGRRDAVQAAAWYRFAAERGHAEAQYRLAVCLRQGKGVAKDNREALLYYHRAAEQGHVLGMYVMGESYWFGLDVNRDGEEAVRWLTPAAEAGYPQAQLRLGDAYRTGFGVDKDLTASLRYYRLAAAQGEEDAQVHVFLLTQNDDRELDDEGVFLSLCEAYEKKEPGAATALGHCYRYGWGTEENTEAALICYREADRQGEPCGQTALGECYEYGTGVEIDDATGAVHYAKAASYNYPHALYLLAYCYDCGTGVRTNEREAERLFRLAAELGHYAAGHRRCYRP